MQQHIRDRLEELKTQFTLGQQTLAELENKVNELRQTLLRISGAIQVLEELSKTDGEKPVEVSK